MNTIESDRITIGHQVFSIKTEHDQDAGAPWEQDDCGILGSVSDWTRRDKRPGELVLNTDRGSKRFYDFAAAVKRAREIGADAAPYGGTTGERAARAARAEFEHWERWCRDQWEYVGVIVTLLDEDGEETDTYDSIWGIESDCGDYIKTVAYDMALGLADNTIFVGPV